MNSKERLTWISVVGILFLIILLKSCGNSNPFWKKCPIQQPCPTVDTLTVSTLKYDSLVKQIDFLKTNQKIKTVEVPILVPLEVRRVLTSQDTEAIIQVYKELLADCSLQTEYLQEFRDDSLEADMNITVANNRLQQAKLNYKFLFPIRASNTVVTVTKDTIIQGYGSALTFGGGIEAGVNGLYFAGIGPGLSTDKGSHFSIEYNLYKFLTKEDKYSFRVGYHQAIRLKK